MTHVVVLLGGTSSERSVSLNSGEACARALETLPSVSKVTRLDVGLDVAEKLSALKPDIALNALHGRFGEDGTVQGLLELLRIPYTHSGVLASALAMQKDLARTVLHAAGVSVALGKTVSRFEAANEHPMATPYVVKPIREGSSVGVHIVLEGQAPLAFLAAPAWTYGDDVLVEKYIAGKELTCAVLHDTPLAPVEIRMAGQTETDDDAGFYDFQAKYAAGGSVHLCPAPLPPAVTQRIQDMTVKAHQALGCRGVSRSDFRYNPATGELVVLEVNTQPGMTDTSLVPDMARHAGMSFAQLVDWMIRDASVDR
jgi:D-alanine-D-alanine ligase